MIKQIIIIVAAYLLGSTSFSYIIAKLLKGIDIREYGTRNAGASNVFLVVGTFAGALALILDVAKGIIAVLLASGMPDYMLILTGITCILGHSFPIFLKFKGGKGLASSIGVLLALAPLETIIGIALVVLISFVIKRLSLALLISLSLLP
jgi:glycerol-3-phosphate acyltransferase PlsY